MTQNKTLNPLGWGFIEDAFTPQERKGALASVRAFFPKGLPEAVAPPPATDISLPECRLSLPPALADFVSDRADERLLHAAGRSLKDLIRLRSGTLPTAPDLIARPRDETQLLQVLEWANTQGHAVIPFGGGTSVCGGVNPDDMDDFNGVISLNLTGLDRVLDVDERAQTVRAQGGIFGPALDAALESHSLTARHFPQSYIHSTLGGWVATRSAGHFSTGENAKIEDRVQALRVVLPDGRRVDTRPLPAGSVGPDPNRLWCGSEGTLGIITEVSLRVMRPPAHRAGAGIVFPTFEAALDAAREMLQAGLRPAQMRILDPFEHLLSAMLAGRSAQGALMVLACESPAVPVEAEFAAALEIARAHGGEQQPAEGKGSGDWRRAFFRQPYLRDVLLDYSIIGDTFETAVPWSRVPAFYQTVRQATLDAVMQTCGAGGVNCRVTHVYRDGLCLYFSFFGRGTAGALAEQFQAIRDAGAAAVMANGGTMSHHHAMGRDHRDRARDEIPAAFRAAIRGAKSELDPRGIMNPGLWFRD